MTGIMTSASCIIFPWLGIIRDFMDHRTPSFGEVQEFFTLFVEFQNPTQQALLTL